MIKATFTVSAESGAEALTIAVGTLQAIVVDPQSGAYGQLARLALEKIELLLGMGLTVPKSPMRQGPPDRNLQ